ncbi:MAG: ATP-binding cassette domain-containing protein [Treponema sp.]|jgi:simple sugar transport system ATP-binding protein|nr:ATP-binding cassette domain-containing protein [Treponema sp.]
MIELKGITKYFSSNNVLALDNADFTLMPAEIHALLGENGAGKSTLMHILAGFTRSGGGTILVDGKERCFKSPADALTAGIGMVRQHPHPLNGFKVWEDCVLGAEISKSHVAEISKQWGFDLPLDAPAESLKASQRQIAAILALIIRDVRYFIFDEPAAVLSSGETESLFDLMRRLKDAGKGIVLISHKLNEALGFADRVTVLRRGKTAVSREASSLSSAELEYQIFGSVKEPPALRETPQFSFSESVDPVLPAEPVLSVKDLSVEITGKPFIRNINLELTGGKIFGITGVLDSGLETLELALAGFSGVNAPSTRSGCRRISGRISVMGREVYSVRSFRAAGGAYLGEDRLGKNIIPSHPLKESLIIHAHRRSTQGFWGKFGIMNKSYLDSFCIKIMKCAGINRKARNMAYSFSGGMLQRILLAREFEENPSLFILSGGSWGLDQQNREKFAEQLRAFVNSGPHGKAALVFSSDPDELLDMADEILVIRNGSFSARISLSQGAEDAVREIRRAMVGSNTGKEGRH